MDMLTGFGVIAAMVLFFATAAALVEWWDTTWREAVSPIRDEVYAARIHSLCLLHSWWWGGRRAVA